MSYTPYTSIGGIGGMYEYENATVMGIDQVNTYHPCWTAGVVAGVLDGWSFLAGVSGTFTAVANAGGGQVQITTSAPHGMTAGQVVTITSASDAGYRPPNPQIFVIQSVGASTFNVVATFTSTATGTYTRGACLTAGPRAAGKYELLWSLTAQAASGTNKQYKFEPCQNAVNVDKGAAGQLMSSTGPQCCSGGAFVTVSAGDVFTLLCNNQTDTTDITITDLNYRLKRYSQ
jgi:hypothetical protein